MGNFIILLILMAYLAQNTATDTRRSQNLSSLRLHKPDSSIYDSGKSHDPRNIRVQKPGTSTNDSVKSQDSSNLRVQKPRISINDSVTDSRTSNHDFVKSEDPSDWRFKDYIKKFEPRTVYEQVDQLQKARGFNYSSRQFVDMMIKGVDGTDEFLKLQVQDIDPPDLRRDHSSPDARRWKPPVSILPDRKIDKFDLRVRLYELMRQAIYQARNEMVFMQIMRENYRNSSLYKMGFLMSKTDNAVKTFSKFAYRIFRLCSLSKGGATDRIWVYDLLVTEERLLNLWFNAELLIELVFRNDWNAKDAAENYDDDIMEHWKYEERRRK